MTPDEQLAEWVKGNSIHNPDRDECCPDFSCCDHSLLASEEDRKAFADGDQVVRDKLLAKFLSNMLRLSNTTAIGGNGLC